MLEVKGEIAGSGDTAPSNPEEDRGWALCLSGGGFRATLFHLGSLLRLNELGVLGRLSHDHERFGWQHPQYRVGDAVEATRT